MIDKTEQNSGWARHALPLRVAKRPANRATLWILPILAVVVLLAATGCHHAVSKSGSRVVMDDIHIVGGTDAELGLDSYDSETLMHRGAELFEAGNFTVAAKFYARVLRDYPESSRAKPALFNLGLCKEMSGDCDGALAMYERFIQKYGDEGGTDAKFRTGACLITLERYSDAKKVFEDLKKVSGLTDNERLEINVCIGVCEFGEGGLETAEMSLIRAMGAYRSIAQKEYIENNYFMAEAQFYLGEIDRVRMEKTRLEFPQEKLEKDLELKAQRLLDAQNQYIKTIRIGNIHWAAAAGYRAGELYETFYRQLMDTPVPPELDEFQGTVYREELRKNVSVLISKAINIYEKTLDMAQRVKLDSKWVEDSRLHIAKLKDQYLRENF